MNLQTTDPWRLEGRRILITGASRGIGRACAIRCAELGARVHLAARGEAELRTLEEQAKSQSWDLSFSAVDLATASGRGALLADLQNRWSALDGLVNNLGTNIRKPSLDYALADLQELMAINVEPAWELSRACFPWLKESRGSIVNLSSVAAERAVRSSTAAYAMSKGAIEGMTRFFACEWAPLGVRINAVRPWYTKTPLAEQVLKDPDKRAAILARTPQGRIPEAEEVANLVAFLLMAASSAITGQCLNVDAGFSASGF